MKETLSLVADYVPSGRLIELAGNLVKQNQIQEQEQEDAIPEIRICLSHPVDFSENCRFHCALVLEALGEVMRRIGKMKLLPKSIKSTLNDTLSPENRAELLDVPLSRQIEKKGGSSGMNAEYLRIVSGLCRDVNKLIEEAKAEVVVVVATSPSKKATADEFSSKLIDGMLKFLCSLELENYPRELKTIVFLCSIFILMALAEQKSNDEVLNGIVKICTVCCTHAQGNDILFGVKWIHLYKWLEGSAVGERLERNVQKAFSDAILGNIYLSQKLATEFEEVELERLLRDDMELTSNLGNMTLNVVEFLVKV
jgi:hypothetical protein